MRLKTKYLLVGLATLTLLSSCSIAPDDIRIEEWNRVDVVGSTLSPTRVNVGVKLVNDSRIKVTLRDAHFRLLNSSGSELLEMVIGEPVVLPRRSEVEVTLPLIIRYKGEAGVFSAVSQLQSGISNLRVSGMARLKGGGINKKYDWQDIPLPEFLQALGIDDMGDFKLSL